MKVLIALCAIISCALSAAVLPTNEFVPIVPFEQSQPANLPGSRISNGHAAVANQFPYQVSVQSPVGGGVSVCGGSIISPNWVLSAAHCTIGHAQVNLRFGSLNQFAGGISQSSFHVINHAQFHPVTLNNDISLVSIPSALTFTAAVQSVRLPTGGQFGTTFNDWQSTVSGWGATVQGGGVQTLLRWVHMRVIPNAQCSAVFGTAAVVPHVVCALGFVNPGNQGHCGGDSGGPLVISEGGINTQIGVVAWGADGGCGAGFPSGYMRTSHFTQWVNTHTGIPIRG